VAARADPSIPVVEIAFPVGRSIAERSPVPPCSRFADRITIARSPSWRRIVGVVTDTDLMGIGRHTPFAGAARSSAHAAQEWHRRAANCGARRGDGGRTHRPIVGRWWRWWSTR
jgi:hypothetical protein